MPEFLVNHGVTLTRDDGVRIVVLDGEPFRDDVREQIDALCDLLGAPLRRERHDEREDEP